MNTEKLYSLFDLSNKVVSKQDVLISEDSKASNKNAINMAESMLARKKGQKPVQEDAVVPVKPFLYS